MVTAFIRQADGQVDTPDSLKAALQAAARSDAIAWIDLEAPTEAQLATLGSVLGLSADAIDDCLRGEQRPRVDEFDDHFFIVVYGMLGPEDSRDGHPRKLTAFCGQRFLVTTHAEPLRSIQAVRNRCGKFGSSMLARGPDFVLFSVLDGMVDNYVVLSDAYESRLDEIEDASLDPQVDESVIARLSELRRDLLELKQLAVSQRELLLPFAQGDFDYISESLQPQFRHVLDHVTRVVEIIDGMRELLNGVRDNYHSALAARTNATMQTLTLMATIMLPLSLVAGIYGMNVRLWPGPDHPWSFVAILVVMGLTALALLAYFRRKRWL